MPDNQLTEKRKRISLLNVPVDVIPEEAIEETIRSLVAENKKQQLVFLDLRGLLRARGDSEFARVVKDAALVVPTAKSIIAGARFLHKEIPIRYMPFNFVIKVLGVLEKYNHSLYLLGAKPAALHKAASNLRDSFPGLRIVGRYSGFYKKEHEQNVILAIKKAAPTLLLVGQGLKGKDRWIYRQREHFFPGLYLFCPRCFSIFSGRQKKIDNESWEKGTYIVKDVIKKPWKIPVFFFYLYYGLLLLGYKIRKL